MMPLTAAETKTNTTSTSNGDDDDDDYFVDPMFDDLNVLAEIEKGHVFASRRSADRVTVVSSSVFLFFFFSLCFSVLFCCHFEDVTDG